MRVGRPTSMLSSSELRDALRNDDSASMENYLEAMIVRTWRPTSSEVQNMQLEMMILHTSRH